MKVEPVTVVILSRDHAADLGATLDAVLDQLAPEDEAVVVDAGSTDGTPAAIERYAREHPGRVRAHLFPVDPGFAAARAAGVEMARRDVVAFLDGDAAPEPRWLDHLRAALAKADVVYGRQRHAPRLRNAPTVARGLRYHRFERDDVPLPETLGSSVNAAYRRIAFETLRAEADDADDAAFARLARYAGLRIAYAPKAIVRHRDDSTWASELRDRLREGEARARLRGLLGTPRLHLLWALTVGLLGVAAIATQSAWLLALTLLAFFLPTFRRLATPVAARYPPLRLAAGAAVSPVFDLAFVGGYVGRRVRAARG